MADDTTTQSNAFASVQQMDERTDGVIPTDRPFLGYALDVATRMIRDHCGWFVGPVTTETLYLDGPGSRLLVLPTLRVVEVLAVRQDGVALPADAFRVSRGSGMLRTTSPLSEQFGALEVDLRHGYDDVPEPIVDLTLQMAARALGSPLGVVREQSLVANITWSTTAAGVAGGTVIMEHELAALAPYTIGTLP
ncbi:hypothetical protein [Curtobacterium sp. MCBD17_008]|uniref:hypothetical protein n=1 Tax=Curtobacterium sp. MCBD17_008 TaxID=2175656 RepID=UPI000DAA6CC8|nr:hypothetical protein [Curtobacterium sp. MCBD17_008]PZE89945.1 hypothetical protein DEI95_13055 [Curtobacterium sp. MCBD17_008]